MLNKPTKRKKKKIMKPTPTIEETETNESNIETDPEVESNFEETVENFIDLSDSSNFETTTHGTDLNISEPELVVLDDLNNSTKSQKINFDVVSNDEDFKATRTMTNKNNYPVVQSKDLPRKNKHFRNPDHPLMTAEEIKNHGLSSCLIIGHTKETLNPMAAKMMVIRNSKLPHIRKRI